MYHHWSLENICIIIRYMKKSLVTEALTSSEVHFDASGEMASDLEAFAEGLEFPVDFDPYHKPPEAFQKIWAWNLNFLMADSEALAANLVLLWCHCLAWLPAWLWASFCSCLRWLSSPIFGTPFHDPKLQVVKCESIQLILIQTPSCWHVHYRDGIKMLSGLTRSWQISLLMLVTLPLMALGAVLMATAVEDAMSLSSKPSMHASFLLRLG